jgi:three-Cys-motif partner protein
MALKIDKVGYWTEIKLDIVRSYAAVYSNIMTSFEAKHQIKKHIYIDAFAGAGVHISKTKGEFIQGSPLNALHLERPFLEYHFIDLDRNKVSALREYIGERKDVFLHEEDCSKVLLKEVLPRCKYEDFHRALCLLDPYCLNVSWEILETAGSMKSVEVFYNFMIMDANMNVLWNNPDSVPEEQQKRMDYVWGDSSWKSAAYRKEPGLFEDLDVKRGNNEIAQAFRERLEKRAGFKFVPEPLPMRNRNGAVIYYLYFASPNKTGKNIVSDIFSKYRDRVT